MSKWLTWDYWTSAELAEGFFRTGAIGLSSTVLLLAIIWLFRMKEPDETYSHCAWRYYVLGQVVGITRGIVYYLVRTYG